VSIYSLNCLVFVTELVFTARYELYHGVRFIIIIIINTLRSVPSPDLQLLAPTLLRSSNCSPSLWSVVV